MEHNVKVIDLFAGCGGFSVGFEKAGYEVSLIWIQTDINTLRARMKKRFKSVAEAKNAFDDAAAKLEAPTEAENPIILSGKHTFETQTRHVLAGLADVN